MKEKIEQMKSRRAGYGIQDVIYLSLMQQIIEEMAERIEALENENKRF